MEGSHHLNWNSIIYQKEATQERPFLAAMDFNTNLVQFLNFYCRIMLSLVMCTSALLRTRFPTCTDVHIKRFYIYMHKILCTENYNLWRAEHSNKSLILLNINFLMRWQRHVDIFSSAIFYLHWFLLVVIQTYLCLCFIPVVMLF